MNLWNEHVDYLKDNPEGYWFKGKLYGFGWTLAKPAGWGVTLTYILVVFLVVFFFDNGYIQQDFHSLTKILGGITLLFLVIVWKTGEPLRWRWGRGHGIEK